MTDIIASSAAVNVLGRQGENGHRRIIFNVSAYLEEYPQASFAVLHKLPNASEAHAAEGTTISDGRILWVVGSEELTQEGFGIAEIVVTQGEVVAKSAYYRTQILPALSEPEPEPEPEQAGGGA